MNRARVSLATILLVFATAWLVGCDGGGSGGPAGPGDPNGPDRSGTWNFSITSINPCVGDPPTSTFSVDLIQSGTTLTGTQCNDGTLENITLTLSGSSNTSFSGTSTSCNSINQNCQAPFGPDCNSTTIQGSISGSTFSGTYSNNEGGCGDTGTFTGTIS